MRVLTDLPGGRGIRVVLSDIDTLDDLARVLRHLRRREARERSLPELTYRDLAAKTGWSVGAIGSYFSGQVLPSTSRFDTLIRLLGATQAEQGMLATARDRVAERRTAPGRQGIQPAQPADEDPTVTDPVRPSRPAVPRQLPADAPAFAGRVEQLAALDGLLAGPGARVAAVSGTAGVGKTTVAVHWAHRVADRFPDGQLYVNLRGFDPAGTPLEPATALHGFLVALGVPAAQIPAGADERTALYRSLLATRQTLVLLDNAADAAQVRPLLPGSPGCVVIVTSRNRLTGLVAVDGARAVVLAVMSTGEATEMLAARLGPDQVAAHTDAVDQIVDRCGGLPLGLAVAAARVIADEVPLPKLAGELGRPLDALAAGEAASDVRTVLSWSYRMLPDGAARMFRLFGVHPGPDIGLAAAASLAAVPATASGGLLRELARANLLTEQRPGRFACHDLLRAYAVELAGASDADGALARVLDHYTRTANTATMLLDSRRGPIEPPPTVAGAQPERLADLTAALTWYAAEYPVLIAATEAAWAHGFPAHACHLAWTVGWFQRLRGHWQDWLAGLRIALAAADQLGDRAWLARIHRDLIGVYGRLDRYDDSRDHARQALDLYREMGDLAGQAGCHRNLCLTLEREGRPRDALEHAARSRDLLRGADDQARLAYAYNSVGWYHALLGEFDAALTDCQEAVRLLRLTGDRHGEASTWDSLGYAYHHLARHDEALECYRLALALFREFGDQFYEADTLDHVGDTHQAMGDSDAARQAWLTALSVLDELEHPRAAEIRAKTVAA
ncbi:tetratricopeptide repeat protein [Plantactinospora sp. S1510]|uniref:Tetratricopeptide repeat protein n=1 Tax=Plantactinospora alkalitolerans TaxID=2789879 RepID=A0ABS0GZC5_9ACTN|nr:helix-turn-helix domain-containing protein [Plantactinospora alkalitolerans]MBF9131563.1 tetratricopeptide repeat protein [Plantactinospora alkalitolerans]